MTLLNSVLILGGILGSFNRPELPFNALGSGSNGISSPFKRIDLFKKRLWPKRANHKPNNVIIDDQAIQIEALVKDLMNKNKHFEPLSNDIFPRMLDTIKRNDRRRSDNSDSAEIEDVDPTDCALLIQCTDAKGKPYYPTLSSLTKTAVQ
ncbi:hypothetical protein BLA29_010049 [Euroglyphus maynei]|uniref:Uncharacterized protein n=1 Tax=Euroglyphus maynei TaxID=6958 RepID=A0A1Y3AT08_EURMA|nr:hypothetical protein BLA29_010049 [Euroglyphus maynei]